jgi:hypothetical protein
VTSANHKSSPASLCQLHATKCEIHTSNLFGILRSFWVRVRNAIVQPMVVFIKMVVMVVVAAVCIPHVRNVDRSAHELHSKGKYRVYMHLLKTSSFQPLRVSFARSSQGALCSVTPFLFSFALQTLAPQSIQTHPPICHSLQPRK